MSALHFVGENVVLKEVSCVWFLCVLEKFERHVLSVRICSGGKAVAYFVSVVVL